MLEIVKIKMMPPSGWIYQCPDGFVVEAKRFPVLIERVKQHYRVNKEFPPVDLEAQVQHQICLRNPQSICKGDGPKRFVPSMKQVVNGTRALIEIKLRGEGSFVDEEEANRRAEICVGCKHNIQHGGCFFCDEMYKLVKKSFNRTSVHDKHLRVCGVCGCLNAAQIFVSKEVLMKTSPKDSWNDYPEHCWKKKILNTEAENG